MSENIDKGVTPIKAGLEIGPPDPDNITYVKVDPHLRVVDTEKPPIKKPEQPNKRQFFKKSLAALFGGLAAIGATKALQTKRGKDILNASPFTPHENNRPPVTKQLQEVNQNLKSQSLPPTTAGYDPETLKIMDKIKAQNNTNKSN